jgi:hypothetical protein
MLLLYHNLAALASGMYKNYKKMISFFRQNRLTIWFFYGIMKIVGSCLSQNNSYF